MNKVSLVKSFRHLHRAGKRTVFVFPGHEEISRYLAREWQDIAATAIEERGRFAAALSGGNTPANFYSELPNLLSGTLWSNTHLFMVDERCVPRDDKASNETLLERSQRELTIMLSGEELQNDPCDQEGAAPEDSGGNEAPAASCW